METIMHVCRTSVRPLRGIYKLCRYSKTVLTQYVVDDARELVYIVVPKTGCSSVKQSFADGTESDDQPLHRVVDRKLYRARLTKTQKKYFKFAFVRNPFDRLVSCYVHKIKGSEHRLRKNYWGFATINREENFESFVKKVARIPDAISDAHFQSQYAILYHRGKPLYDKLGHFETLADDFEPIRAKYNLKPLPHVHNTKKGDWREFYTPELAEIVYKRYQKDFEVLGYEKEYEKLLEYLESSSSASLQD